MKITVLGCSGAELPGHNPPGFLIGDDLLLDAGAVTSVLPEEAQRHLRHIFITHGHLDHIRSIPALADNIILRRGWNGVKIYGIKPVLDTIRDHLLNDHVWPDFTNIPNPDNPVMTYAEIETGRWITLNGLKIMAIPVNHSVPATGYLVDFGGRILLYTGDTGPTGEIWRAVERVHTVIVEVSFPERMTAMALKTGHMSPSLMKADLAKLKHPPERVLVTHLKPQTSDEILPEIEALGIPGLTILKDGDVYGM